MQPFSKVQLVSLIAAVLLAVSVFTVPIVSFVAFGDEVGSHTLYDATLDSYDRESRIVPVTIALVLIIASVGLLAAHALSFASQRYALFGVVCALLSIGAFVAFHASAQRIEIFGYEVASTSLAFGSFVPAIIGLTAIIAYRVLE